MKKHERWLREPRQNSGEGSDSVYKKNMDEFDISRITEWHKAGYLGEGINIAILDDHGGPNSFMDYTVYPFDNHWNTGHATSVAKIIHEVLPLAKIFVFNFLGKDSNDKEIMQWLSDHRDEIDLINGSISSNDNDLLALKDIDIPFICAAGNDGNEERIRNPARYDWTIAVGAWVEFRDAIAHYSNWGKMLDCVDFTNIYIPNSEMEYFRFNGTSAAAPMTTGKLGLIAEYLKRRGKKLTRELAKKIVHKSTIDKYEEGFDIKSGHGLFILPKFIEMNKYLPIEEGEIMRLRKGEIKFAVIHHTAKLNEYTADEVLRIHRARGFATYGYNKLIEPNGNVVMGRDPKYRGAHTYVEAGKTEEERQYWNENALGYCLVWNGEEKPFPEIMYKSLARELKDDGFAAAQIRLHREVDATSCPGKYFDKSKLMRYLEDEYARVKVIKTDVAPFTVHVPELNGDRTVLEVRTLIEDICGGKIVSWNNKTEKFIAHIDNKKIEVQIGNPEIKIEEV